jgi:hypothetical protein
MYPEQQKKKCYECGKSSNREVYLYKISEKEELGKEDEIFWGLSKDELAFCKNIGQIYDPNGKHSWEVNMAWLQGVFEVERKVIIYSPLKMKYFKRREGDRFSAFAREIAVLIKAGYKPNILENKIVLVLEQNEQSKKEFNDIIDDNEIHIALKNVLAVIIRKINDMLETIESGTFSTIEELLRTNFLNMFSSDNQFNWEKFTNSAVGKEYAIHESPPEEDLVDCIDGVISTITLDFLDFIENFNRDSEKYEWDCLCKKMQVFEEIGLVYGECAISRIDNRFLDISIEKLLLVKADKTLDQKHKQIAAVCLRM